MIGFRQGVNLGGWLSQCEERKTPRHFASFITRADLDRIAGWGFDHVRLPVDADVLWEDGRGFRPEAAERVDACLAWCGELGLGLLLDMHGLPGYNIATPLKNTLFENEEQQILSCEIWRQLSARYRETGDQLRFELLNEPEWPNGYAVQRFYGRLIREIRTVDENRVLVITGNHYAHVDGLEGIRLPGDPKVICTFHYYEPNLFTNQLWGVVRGDPEAYPGAPDYPGGFPGLREYLDLHPESAAVHGKYCWIRNDRRLMEENIRKAADFRRFTGREIYLGEFGVCYHAEASRRCAWLEDLLSVCGEADIGWCYWTYKEMDYGLVSPEGRIISPEVLRVLRAHLR